MQRCRIEPKWDNVWVVFSPFTDLLYLKVLKREFRHCFVVLEDSGRFIVIEPLSSKIEVFFIEIFNISVERYFELFGLTVVKTKIIKNRGQGWNFGVFTCVEVVKRILNIKGKSIITPYQLYKRLIK